MAFPSFLNLGSRPLRDLLGVKRPDLTEHDLPDPLRQLDYIGRYVAELGCTIVVVEKAYIDRDYMEDHSVFYSRSFAAYPNSCERVHFFADIDETILRAKFEELAEAAGKDDDVKKGEYRGKCREFSHRNYLGFMVLKPLNGSPVGRTVLRPFPREKLDKKSRREFDAARVYAVHLLGVELSVCGLPFQQQDQGVSACATTAIWSSLHSLRSLEEVAAATPAQVTNMASRFALPFGRAMPSEGLSLDQMCQAVHAFGVSPDLVRAETFRMARSQIYSAALSGAAPILILQRSPSRFHAVAVAGIKRPSSTVVEGRGTAKLLNDRSASLQTVYIHDDRWGPYISAELRPVTKKEAKEWGLSEEAPKLIYHVAGRDEVWALTYILVPVHPKVRLSFTQIQKLGWRIASALFLETQSSSRAPVDFDTRILRAHTYVEKLLSGQLRATSRLRKDFFGKICLSRYVGVVRISRGNVGPFDALIDTTGTRLNVSCLGIVNRGEGTSANKEVGSLIAERFKCKFITG